MPKESESTQVDRRRILISFLGSAPLVALSIGTAAATQKIPQNAVAYQESPKGGQSCAGCNFFLSPNHCKRVAGQINPSGWCHLWTKAG
jgi:hypothetical protein